MTDSKEIKRKIREELDEEFSNDERLRAALLIVSSFDLSSERNAELFEKYRKRMSLPDFMSFLAALKASAWYEIGEEPMDKLKELDLAAEEESLYANLPGDVLVTLMTEKPVEDTVDDDDEESFVAEKPEDHFL